MKYKEDIRMKYIGTEEQLLDFGYNVLEEGFFALKDTGILDKKGGHIEVYIALDNDDAGKWYFKQNMISFNNPDHDYEYYIKDFIQDLMKAGLVEVQECIKHYF